MIKTQNSIALISGLLLLICLFVPLNANTQPAVTVDAENLSRAQRINELSELIKLKTAQKNSLRETILKNGQNTDEEDREKLKVVSEDLDSLRESFLFAVLGTRVDIQSLYDEVAADTTWQEDVVEVLKPLADTLKSVTRRPREVASLREKIETADQKTAAIQSAITVAEETDKKTLSSGAATTLDEYLTTWRQELEQVRQDKLLAQSQLDSLESNNDSGWTGIWTSARQFFLGRGLTLLLAIVAAIAAWLVMRYLWWAYSTKIASKDTRRKSTLYRFAAYSYYILTGFMVMLAVLVTLWVREDLLLLAIAFIALASLALGLRQYVPNYITEARLLLNLGNVREDERVVYDGLPWQVMSLNIQSVLRNPAIDGVIRLSLSTMAQLSSRPIKNNLWFPTKKGDYVILPDGPFGQIRCQTPDLVEVAVAGGITMTYPTRDFFSLQIQNLTGDETFGVSTTFGLDYNLQPICLTTVPDTLRTEIHNALVSAGYEKHVKSELVELASANDSSLDYIVFITLSSDVASSYYAIKRLLVQTCIDVSNANNWSIPFPQLTVHNASS
jgi:small-conductance mechanosensitive channel